MWGPASPVNSGNRDIITKGGDGVSGVSPEGDEGVCFVHSESL